MDTHRHTLRTQGHTNRHTLGTYRDTLSTHGHTDRHTLGIHKLTLSTHGHTYIQNERHLYLKGVFAKRVKFGPDSNSGLFATNFTSICLFYKRMVKNDSAFNS